MDIWPTWLDWHDTLARCRDHPAAHAFAIAHGFVITSSQLRAIGVDRDAARRMIRAGRWHQPRRGVVAVVPDPRPEREDFVRRRAEVTLAATSAAVVRTCAISHASAAVLWELPTLALPRRPVITIADRVDAVSRPDVRTHAAALPADQRTTWFGVPATTPARTVVDLARQSLRGGVMAADAALAAGIAAAEMDSVVATCSRWPGIIRARQAVSLARVGAESPLESLVRLALYEAGLPEPELQVDIWDGRGLIGRVDFLYRAARLIIEADGLQKYSDVEVRRERRRQARLVRLGYTVVRVLWEEIRDRPWEFIAEVRRAIAA